MRPEKYQIQVLVRGEQSVDLRMNTSGAYLQNEFTVGQTIEQSTSLSQNDELCEELYKFFGKEILHHDIILRNRELNYGNKKIIRLPLNVEIRETIKNEKADCSVFATVVNDEENKNDFFNCQIYHPRDDEPNLLFIVSKKKQNVQPFTS
ncbi:hypothetical protein C1646_759602 [Rhizophagus diaphanus]|nr:hypothetical protein C1646_759602 [Rhizophagus diaphanus] [Rhizophagus sp. MUCL 43196]